MAINVLNTESIRWLTRCEVVTIAYTKALPCKSIRYTVQVLLFYDKNMPNEATPNEFNESFQWVLCLIVSEQQLHPAFSVSKELDQNKLKSNKFSTIDTARPVSSSKLLKQSWCYVTTVCLSSSDSRADRYTGDK